MTPGEITLLKIIAETTDANRALALFEIAFPTKLASYAFEQVIKSLIAKRWIARTHRGKRLALTESGKDVLTAELRAESEILQPKQDP